MSKIKSFISYLWQLPQNIMGLFVVYFSKATYNKVWGVYDTEKDFGVSLGKYVILYKYRGVKTIKHEKGHQKQSLYFGWLYLLIIGLPSALGNLWDRIFHKKWTSYERERWYYNLPWEHWADKLGRVYRKTL